MILIAIVVALLTAVYTLAVGAYAWEDVALGLGLSAVLLALYRHLLLPKRLQPVSTTIRAVAMFPLFALMSIREIVLGSVAVAGYVLGIRKLEHPGIVAVPIAERTPTGVGMSAMILTMSPGSFLVDVDWRERLMYVHVMDASDPDKVRRDLQTFYDRYQRHVVP